MKAQKLTKVRLTKVRESKAPDKERGSRVQDRSRNILVPITLSPYHSESLSPTSDGTALCHVSVRPKEPECDPDKPTKSEAQDEEVLSQVSYKAV